MTTTRTWWGDDESKPAPDGLRGVQALVNTLEIERGRDRLATPEAESWLIRHGFVDRGAHVTAEELRDLTGFREGLRALIVQNTDGTEPDAAVLAPLRAVAADVPLRASLGSDGTVEVAPVEGSVRDRLVELLLAVRTAQCDGTWTHLKACANDNCLWAFYDRSRNHGGTWCDMSTCGNKLKNRDFRARRRADH